MRQKSIKLGVLVLLAALLASLVIPAWAALPEKESSLTITFQYQSTVLPNGVFRAYRVAAASDTGKYPLTEKFLDGTEPTVEELKAALRKGCCEGPTMYISLMRSALRVVLTRVRTWW